MIMCTPSIINDRERGRERNGEGERGKGGGRAKGYAITDAKKTIYVLMSSCNDIVE